MKAGMAQGGAVPAVLRRRRADLRHAGAAVEDGRAAARRRPSARRSRRRGGGAPTSVTLKADDAGPFVAQVFKTISEPHVGDVTYFRIYSGHGQERAGRLQRPARGDRRSSTTCASRSGKERTEVAELHAGRHRRAWPSCATPTPTTRSRPRTQPIVLPKIPVPGAGDHRGGRGEAAGRGGQAVDRAAQAARGGSDLPARVQRASWGRP